MTATVWSRRWFHPVGGAPYDFVMEHEMLARPFGRILWGWDVRLITQDVHRHTGRLPPGSAILDVPCGGGLILRDLDLRHPMRIVAADISSGMLDRARRQAARRDELSVRFIKSDVTALAACGFEFDLIFCFNGLDIFPDPEGAVKSLAKCLKPGSSLVGDMVMRGVSRRYDSLIRLYQRRGIFGPGGTYKDLEAWLSASGFGIVKLRKSGAVTHFEATIDL